jgi:hypothetical protein
LRFRPVEILQFVCFTLDVGPATLGGASGVVGSGIGGGTFADGIIGKPAGGGPVITGPDPIISGPMRPPMSGAPSQQPSGAEDIEVSEPWHGHDDRQ